MKTIKRPFRWVLRLVRGARYGLADLNLQQVDFKSGLGDSAWLLFSLARTLKPVVCVEIGSARGRSTCFLAKALKENQQGIVYAIDPHTATEWNDTDSVDTYTVLLNNLKKMHLAEYVNVIRGTSREAAQKWKLGIDLLFIDGDHTYEGAKHDWDAFSPFVREFGLVVFHDTLWDLQPDHPNYRPDMGVPRFVEELRRQGFPVITLKENFGVSIVQPVKQGIRLSPR
jgi:predicted O-methyltransferase YrrM